ncbi:hypothetical protein F4779DRAFT_618868 [Xylariaceae sp. FL0662B]|nr:hypothetical protein F4779DRAFT_618868 [Xylariaceae sp. FL0662B]
MAEAGQNTTLRLALTQNKVPCNEQNSKNTCPTSKWPKIQSVEVWREFNLSNLNGEYTYLLDQPIPETPLRVHKKLDGISIQGFKDIRLLISRNDALMQPTLDIAKSQFIHAQGLALSHAYKAFDGPTVANVEGHDGKVSVDHDIALDKVPRRNLVVGLGRSSRKFSMKELLGHFCRAANTPYGYIQTDQELVACYFKKHAESEISEGGVKRDKFDVYVMPIPWSSHGPTVLTTDLGLWWLCMKALSPQYDPQIEDIAASGTAAALPPEYPFQLTELGGFDPNNSSTWDPGFLGSI